MENEIVVNDELTTQQTSDVIIPESLGEVPEKPFQPGEKTDPAILLKQLQVEREKRRLAEEKINLIETSQTNSENDVWSDEGKALNEKISNMNKELVNLKKESAKKDLLISNPTLKEHLSDFEDYLEEPENKGMNLRTAAKAFMIEKGLADAPQRKGLEKPTGGDKTPATTGTMTAADVKTLRETNYKKYIEMLSKGQLNKIE